MDFGLKFTCHRRRLRESYVHSKHVYTHPRYLSLPRFSPALSHFFSSSALLLKSSWPTPIFEFQCTSIDCMKFQKLHKHFSFTHCGLPLIPHHRSPSLYMQHKNRILWMCVCVCLLSEFLLCL